MPKFLDYNPEQVYLLPPSVRDVLGENHVCFFLHQAVEALDLSAFEQGYADDGRPAYHPALMLRAPLAGFVAGSVQGSSHPEIPLAGCRHILTLLFTRWHVLSLDGNSIARGLSK